MRLLIIEDDRRLAELLVRGLTADGFTVDIERDGQEGFWLAKENTYDVIVLDIMLPGLNGYRVCANLRSADVMTPILMLTAKDGELDEIEGLDTGADDYLTKPFSYQVLVARLRALARRGGAVRPPVLSVADLRLDPAVRSCHRNGEPIALTLKEYAVLEFLLRRADQVVTKSEIIAGVWDAAQDPDPNIVEVYISALRRKIDAPFRRRTISTVRGIGYRLVSQAETAP